MTNRSSMFRFFQGGAQRARDNSDRLEMSKRANMQMAREALAALPYGDMALVVGDAVACREDADAEVTHRLANALSRHADDLQRDPHFPADYSVQAPTGGDSAREGRPCAQSFPRDLGIGAATEIKRGY